MFQKDVAEIIGVTEDCITLWEKNHREPGVVYYPQIIRFLEYFPWDIPEDSLAGKIRKYRYVHGLTYKKMGTIVGVDATTIQSWECKKSSPLLNALEKLSTLLGYISR